MSIEKLNPEQVKPQWAMNVDYISKINEIIDHINKVIVKNDHVVDGVMYGIQESIKLPEHVWSPVERAKLQHKKFENLQERYRRLEDAHKKLVKGHKKATLKIADLNRSNIGLIKKVKELNDDPLGAKLLQTQNDLIDLRNEYNSLMTAHKTAVSENQNLRGAIVQLKEEIHNKKYDSARMEE